MNTIIGVIVALMRMISAGKSLLGFKAYALWVLLIGVLADFAFHIEITWGAIVFDPKGRDLGILISCIVVVVLFVIIDAVLILRDRTRRMRLWDIVSNPNIPENIRLELGRRLIDSEHK